MKIPCEVVVWKLLPIIRRELARELVVSHGIKQADVAKKFGVTDAAVSQYISGKRGGDYAWAPMYGAFMDAIKESAERLANSDNDCAHEVCILCGTAKNIGLLALIYKDVVGVYPPTKCFMQ